MTKKMKAMAMAVAVPQSRAEFETLAARLGDLMRKIDRVNSKAADAVVQANLAAKMETDALEREAKAVWKQVASYAEAHRSELLPEDRKSVTLAAGTIGWRMSTPSVKFDRPEEEIIEDLEDAGRAEFLRVDTKIDKQAILAGLAAGPIGIDGVRSEQSEKLFFKPLDIESERTKTSVATAKAEAA